MIEQVLRDQNPPGLSMARRETVLADRHIVVGSGARMLLTY
jgi:hypothetical protein